MKIAMFGDSYVALDHNFYKKLPYYNEAWPKKLADAYNVDNFAQSGTGPEWSLMQLNSKKINDYDKIIFCVSEIRRKLIRPEYRPNEFNTHVWPQFRGERIDGKTQPLQDYQRYFMFNDFYLLRLKLIVKHLRKRFGNKILLLPCFKYGTAALKQYYNDCIHLEVFWKADLITADFLEKNSNGKEMQYWEGFRINHLAVQSHRIMYEKIEKWLHGEEFTVTENDVPQVSLEDNIEYKFYLEHRKKLKGIRNKHIWRTKK